MLSGENLCCQSAKLATKQHKGRMRRDASDNRSADDEHRPVAQVDHLVRGAAKNQPGKVTPPA